MTKLGWSLNYVEHFVGRNEGRTEATRLDEIDEGKSQSSTTQRHDGNDTVFGAAATRGNAAGGRVTVTVRQVLFHHRCSAPIDEQN